MEKGKEKRISEGDPTDVGSPFGEYKIPEEGSDNYILEPDDDTEEGHGKQKEHFGDYYDPEDDEPDAPDPDAEYQKQSGGVWSMLFTTMVNPVNGWKAFRRSKITSNALTLKLLLPCCAAAGLSEYFSLIYDPLVGLGATTITAIVTFFLYFASYYLAQLLARIFLPKVMKGLPSTRYGEILAMVGISTLALFHVPVSIFWYLNELLVFLPLWTIYLIFKGMKFVKMEEGKSTYTIGVECVAILCAPLLLEYIFSFILAGI